MVTNQIRGPRIVQISYIEINESAVNPAQALTDEKRKGLSGLGQELQRTRRLPTTNARQDELTGVTTRADNLGKYNQ